MKLNSYLEKEFNLTPSNEEPIDPTMPLDEPVVALEPSSVEYMMETSTELDKIDSALPKVEGMDSVEDDLHALANTAMQSHKDLMDLASSVEPKYIGEITSVASSMLGHAIAAKTNIIKKKIDIISLQLKKQQLDAKVKPVEDDQPTGKGVVMDRTSLIKQIMAEHKNKTDK